VIDIGIELFPKAEGLSSGSETVIENVKVAYLNYCQHSMQDVMTGYMETRADFDYRTMVI
jgi:hypothetical protein